jgi:hypothetical protein
LGGVVGFRMEIMVAVMFEIVQGLTGIFADVNPVTFRPNDHADQHDRHWQRRINLLSNQNKPQLFLNLLDKLEEQIKWNLFDDVDYVENSFQNLVHVASVSQVDGVIDDQHQFENLHSAKSLLHSRFCNLPFHLIT